MEGEHINRAPLAELVERNFGRSLPGVVAEDPDDSLDGRCVPRVEESIKALATPRNTNEQTGAEGRGHAFQGLNLHTRGVALLDPSDHATGDARPSPELRLGQSSPDAERADRSAERDVVHASDGDGVGFTAA